MPRFLDTFSGEFVWKDDPGNVPYAIFSHTWRSVAAGGEQSYDDIRKLQAAVKKFRMETSSSRGGLNVLPPQPIFSHPTLSDKIRGICKVAREAGYRLIWIDSCCIDKASSAELAEAINSMYELYRLANICYVYLVDVPDDDDPRALSSMFRTSRWHSRGWTLQELIAPERVMFLTQGWRPLGSKTALASTLQQITGVDVDILTGRASLNSVSVARRMSWAANRETTRVEDRAYSLLGIFGIHIPPIYGEGTNAFLRLQEEIVKTIPDQTIFAWGRSFTLSSLNAKDGFREERGPFSPGLLANSPSDFTNVCDVIPLSPKDFTARLDRAAGRAVGEAPPLHCVFTPEGARIQLLCIDLLPILHILMLTCGEIVVGADTRIPCQECLRQEHANVLALLRCEDENGALLAIPLCVPRRGAREREGLYVTTHVPCAANVASHWPYHLARLRKDALAEALKHLSQHSIELSLLRHRSDPFVPKSCREGFALRHPLYLWSSHPRSAIAFRIAPGCEDELLTLGFAMTPLLCRRTYEHPLRTVEIVVFMFRGSHHSAISEILLLHVVLTEEETNPWDVNALFQVRHFLQTGRGDISAVFPTTRSNPRDPTRRHASSPDRSDGTYAVTTHLRYSTEHVWSEAEFLVNAHQDNSGWVNLRLLRVRLERPPESSVVATHKVFWLSAELSEPYLQKRDQVVDPVWQKRHRGIRPQALCQ